MNRVKKTIKNRDYEYAQYSFRLPNGTVKTVSQKITSHFNTESFTQWCKQKEIQLHQQWSLQKYNSDSVFTEKRIKEFEEYRVGYKYIKNKLTKKQFTDIIERFTINFTYESNAIEGNSLTLRDVTLLLDEKVLPKNKNLREVYETRNTHEVHQALFANKFSLNLSDIKRIHRIIIKEMDINPGWKKIPNYLLGRSVKTTLPENVETEMQELLNWYYEKKESWHPLKIAAHFHAKFERIHPFEDGNGRVGRVLLNIILLDNGFPPLILRRTMRVRYFSSLEAADDGKYNTIEQFFVAKFRKTYQNFFEEIVKYI